MATRKLEEVTIIEAITDLTSLKGITTPNRQDNVLVNSDLGLFYWDSSSIATPDDVSVILPDDVTLPDPGRWLITSGGSGLWEENTGVLTPITAGNDVVNISDQGIRINGSSIALDTVLDIHTLGNVRNIKFNDESINETLTLSLRADDGLRVDVSEINQAARFTIREQNDELYQIQDESDYYVHHFTGLMNPVIDTGVIGQLAIYDTGIPSFVGTIYLFEDVGNLKAQLDCRLTTLSSTVGGSYLDTGITLVKDTISNINVYFESGTLRIQNEAPGDIRCYLTIIVQKFTTT